MRLALLDFLKNKAKNNARFLCHLFIKYPSQKRNVI